MRTKSTLTNLRCGILAVCIFFTACSKEPQESAETLLSPAPAKNLLLICIDTVRADIFYGLGEAQQDSLSAWQDRALVYEQAISTSSWTLPAIGSVFSGLWQSGHGGGRMPNYNNEPTAVVYTPTAVSADVPLLTEVAEREGFDTAIFSASPWTNKQGSKVGLNRGFKTKANLPLRKDGMWLGQAKIKKVLARKPEGVPFFYFLHLLEAHEWHMSSELELDKRIASFSSEQRALFLRVAPAQACEDKQSLLCKRYLVYASAVSALREALAATLESLKAENLLDDTVVVVFSDHGEEFGEHAEDKRILRVVDSAPDRFQGHGVSMYQELLHVPLMVWHPKYEGAVIEPVVSLVDIGPTVARWLEIDFSPEQWPGHYLDTYLEPPQEAIERVVYASGITVGEQQLSVQQGTKKSIWYMRSDQYAYFDLASDPYELHSEPSDNLVLLFDGLFLDYAQSMQKEELKPVLLTDEQIKRLQSIGYLQGLEAGADAKKD